MNLLDTNMNGYELAIIHVGKSYLEQTMRRDMLYKELTFQRPEVKDIMVKLYCQCGRTKEGRQVLVDKLKSLLDDDKISIRM